MALPAAARVLAAPVPVVRVRATTRSRPVRACAPVNAPAARVQAHRAQAAVQVQASVPVLPARALLKAVPVHVQEHLSPR